MPIDKQGYTRVDHERVKDILNPLMVINVSGITLGELDQTVNRAYLLIWLEIMVETEVGKDTYKDKNCRQVHDS